MHATVYGIKHGDKIVYVGSTHETIARRLGRHRQKMRERPARKLYVYMAEHGPDAFTVEAIAEVDVETVHELHRKEGEYIRLHNTHTNGCNVKVAGRTRAELRAERRIRENHLNATCA